jgi:hypothetical protein
MVAEEFIGNLTSLAGNQTGDIVRSSFGMLMSVPGMNIVIKLFQVAGALAILYLVFLIMKAFAGFRSAKKLTIIANHIQQIDKKMDALIAKLGKKK